MTRCTLSPLKSNLQKDTLTWAHNLPKIDLHRHFEGSLRLETILEIASENAGANHGVLLFENAGAWIVKAETDPAQRSFPDTIINYVARTATPVVLADAV
ncbi:MAG: hypothetical protein P1S60_01155, partial [Anaerolineae bacterium]|nr:hypothetical protein [Anaerolineae bacterium]